MNLKKISTAIILSLFFIQAFSQDNLQPVKENTGERKYSVSTSWTALLNMIGENIDMYELFLGYALTPKDKIYIKTVTWKLYQPLGIPYGSDIMKKGESEWYPGRIREYGVGVGYQRMLWKGLFAAVEVVPMKKTFLDENNKKLENGFRLYTTYHLGYHIPLFKNRFFIEPQIHCNYWPIDSKGPQGFKEKEAKWNNYFLFEPNVYFGVKF